ncbi:phosphohistidine phosphatase [Rhizobiales bacterium GAS113]|jgi:phosphohistidine phosphatase|nr:phosphohistidine phosphatase [Rhizobiales bacterium GAS113]
MKRLLLLRHAKSARPAGISDHVRPLAQRGRDDARSMGRYLRQEMLLPNLALVSTSTRTRETVEILFREYGESLAMRFEERLYEAPTVRLLAVIAETPAELDTLLLVGHNPGMADLAQRLAGHGDRYAFARMRVKFPTCALAVLDLPGDGWRSPAVGSARLDRFVTPKSLGADTDD